MSEAMNPLNWFKKKEKPQTTENNVPQPVPTENNVHVLKKGMRGVDISHHNDVDLDVLVNNVDFIYMKATEGTDFVSNVYESRAKKLKELNNVPWGAYHYYRTNKDPIEQAKHFLKYVDVNSGLPPVIDVEKINNYFRRDDANNVLKFAKYLEEKTGIVPIIYTNYFFARDILKPSAEFARYPLWLAWYTKDFTRVRIPKPWTQCKMWQYSDKGRIEGCSGYIDLNKVIY